MSPENSKNDGSLEGALANILESYPVNQEDVDTIIGVIEAANKKTKLIDPVGNLMAQAGWEAWKNGIKTLPILLAAVAQIEKDIPPAERHLTPRVYIELLAKGENGASERAYWDNTVSHEEQMQNAALHSAKAHKLYGILLHRNTLG